METLPDDYRPSADEPYMNPRHLAYFRLKLETWRAELIAESEQTLENLRNENWQEPDPNDRATHESEASLELRTRDRYRKLIAKIDAAIKRIDQGDYGYCQETGEPIGLARLDARPIATLCVEAQEAHENNERRWAD